MKKPPCIRDLKPFSKSGCPERAWDGEEGCPCWIELSVSTRGEPLRKEIKKQCLDLWLWQFQWAMTGLLEGNQQATESFRNAMCEQGDDGQSHPKPDPGVVLLLSNLQKLMQSQARLT